MLNVHLVRLGGATGELLMTGKNRHPSKGSGQSAEELLGLPRELFLWFPEKTLPKNREGEAELQLGGQKKGPRKKRKPTEKESGERSLSESCGRIHANYFRQCGTWVKRWQGGVSIPRDCDRRKGKGLPLLGLKISTGPVLLTMDGLVVGVRYWA